MPAKNQTLKGHSPSIAAYLTPSRPPRNISGRSLFPQGGKAANPAVLTTASQLSSRIPFYIETESVKEPWITMILRNTDVGMSDSSFIADRTNATTLWPCVRSAAMRRTPRLPVAPIKRTFIFSFSNIRRDVGEAGLQVTGRCIYIVLARHYVNWSGTIYLHLSSQHMF